MKIIWNKVTWYSKLIAIFVFAGAIWLGVYFTNQYREIGMMGIDSAPIAVDTSDWKTYRNEKYGFEIDYPADWKVGVSGGEEAAINIYPANTRPNLYFTHHADVTNVSIFPQGIPAEGVYGFSIESSIALHEGVNNARDYVLKNGDVWATYANFKNFPSSWNESGFLWARVPVKDRTERCMIGNQEVRIDNCYGADSIEKARMIITGTISKEDRKIEEKILSTFKFTK